MLLGFGYLCKFVMFYFFFLLFKTQEIIDSKKASWLKCYNIIFLFLLKIGSPYTPFFNKNTIIFAEPQ